MDAAMFLFLQLKVRLNVLSNIYQTEFHQSPAQACAIDLPELNYGLWSNYLRVIVSKNMACFADVLYQVLTSKKLIIFLANQSFLSKLYFELWDNKESIKENCGITLWDSV